MAELNTDRPALCGLRAIWDKLRRVAIWLLHWRYAVAGILFVVLVVLGVSGSNLGCWDAVLGTPNEESSTLKGVPRNIRSDEWSVLFPMATPYNCELSSGTSTTFHKAAYLC